MALCCFALLRVCLIYIWLDLICILIIKLLLIAFSLLQTSGGVGSEMQFPLVEHLSLSLARIDHVYPEVHYVPKRNRFATRLTAFCRLSNVEPAITSLLGFLPQDLEQVSIFDLVHTSDLLKIYDAYKEGEENDSRKFVERC